MLVTAVLCLLQKGLHLVVLGRRLILLLFGLLLFGLVFVILLIFVLLPVGALVGKGNFCRGSHVQSVQHNAVQLNELFLL
ncbi:MAG: hypothetical protein MJ240_10635, partial [Kiritimatiellae bacterium]|nr:hypothetical protein [Kiritimatiellia bacterium]